MEGLKVRRGRGLGDFMDFFLKLVNFGCVESQVKNRLDIGAIHCAICINVHYFQVS
jgi:hypothetical protein